MDNHKKSPQLKVKELCENCGKLVRHKNSDCPKLLEANVDNIQGYYNTGWFKNDLLARWS